MVSRPSRNVSFFSFCLNLSLLKTAVSRTHLDVLQRDISIDIGNPMDVGLRHLTRLQKMGDVHPIDRGVLPGHYVPSAQAVRKDFIQRNLNE